MTNVIDSLEDKDLNELIDLLIKDEQESYYKSTFPEHNETIQ